MHILHNTIGVPKITQNNESNNSSIFSMSPLPRGFGVTLANSVRRVALSSVPGTKVTGIKVKGVSHEYATLPGIRDSVVDMMLNLKGLIVDKNEVGVSWIKLSKNKAGIVTASDIAFPSDIKLLNPDMYITEIDQDKLELDIEIRVEKGV